MQENSVSQNPSLICSEILGLRYLARKNIRKSDFDSESDDEMQFGNNCELHKLRGSSENSEGSEMSDDEIEKLSWIKPTGDPLDPRDKVGIEDFEILKLLGTGAFGKVWQVKKLNGPDRGKHYAMKVLEKFKVMKNKKTIEHTRSERQVLERIIDCPFLATMYYAFQTAEKLYLVLEFGQGGELFTHLGNSGPFTEDRTRFYIAEIILAIEQLHKRNIIFRDIKLENILLDAKGHIFVTDFGLSKELRGNQRAHSYCGTIEYMAPEIVRRRGHDRLVDYWSIGVLTHELLTCQVPFFRENEQSVQEVIAKRIVEEEPVIGNIGPNAKDLILKLLKKDPAKRLGSCAAELKFHKFFHGIDWEKLKEKEVKPPFVPKLKGDDDVSQFDLCFTGQKPKDKPVALPSLKNAEKYFRGYSYVAPGLRWRVNDKNKDSVGNKENVPDDDNENSERLIPEVKENLFSSHRDSLVVKATKTIVERAEKNVTVKGWCRKSMENDSKSELGKDHKVSFLGFDAGSSPNPVDLNYWHYQLFEEPVEEKEQTNSVRARNTLPNNTRKRTAHQNASDSVDQEPAKKFKSVKKQNTLVVLDPSKRGTKRKSEAEPALSQPKRQRQRRNEVEVHPRVTRLRSARNLQQEVAESKQHEKKPKKPLQNNERSSMIQARHTYLRKV